MFSFALLTVRILSVCVPFIGVCSCARTPDPVYWSDESQSGDRNLGDVRADSAIKSSEDEGTDVDADGGMSMDPDADAALQCAAIRDHAPPAQGVDVIFIVDSSGTMLHALTQVQANVASFVKQFEAAGTDIHVIMITALDPAGSSPVASDNEKYRFIQTNVIGGGLFNVAINQFPNYADFLRPTAAVQFVMVTSSNDLVSATSFETQMRALLGGRAFTQHAIVSPDVNGLPCISEAQAWNPLCAFPIPAICAALQVGRAYNSLAQATGGQQLSVCKDDWGELFGTLRKAVIDAVPLPCNYPLAASSIKKIDPEKVSVVYTDGDGKDAELPRAEQVAQCEQKLGWYYDDPAAPTRVVLCPAACQTVAAGGSVDIAFGCRPPMIL
jgi:hypothetical protein